MVRCFDHIFELVLTETRLWCNLMSLLTKTKQEAAGNGYTESRRCAFILYPVPPLTISLCVVSRLLVERSLAWRFHEHTNHEHICVVTEAHFGMPSVVGNRRKIIYIICEAPLRALSEQSSFVN